ALHTNPAVVLPGFVLASVFGSILAARRTRSPRGQPPARARARCARLDRLPDGRQARELTNLLQKVSVFPHEAEITSSQREQPRDRPDYDLRVPRRRQARPDRRPGRMPDVRDAARRAGRTRRPLGVLLAPPPARSGGGNRAYR